MSSLPACIMCDAYKDLLSSLMQFGVSSKHDREFAFIASRHFSFSGKL